MKLDTYPEYSNNIIGVFFELPETYMFDPDIKEVLIRMFIASLNKNMTQITHRMLIMFLKRISSKIVYIDKNKYQIIMNFLKLALARECSQGDE